jgi:hypothetical protein
MSQIHVRLPCIDHGCTTSIFTPDEPKHNTSSTHDTTVPNSISVEDQNQNWFSLYKLRLVNQTNFDSVSTELIFSADPTKGLAQMVTGFHDHLNYIYLDDGTVFELPQDESFYGWNIGDVVSIGNSNASDYRRYHNLLVNTSNNTYVRCQRIQ